MRPPLGYLNHNPVGALSILLRFPSPFFLFIVLAPARAALILLRSESYETTE